MVPEHVSEKAEQVPVVAMATTWKQLGAGEAPVKDGPRHKT